MSSPIFVKCYALKGKSGNYTYANFLDQQTQQTLKSIESQFRGILQQWRTDKRIRDAKLSAKDVTLSFQTQIEVMNKIVIDFGTF